MLCWPAVTPNKASKEGGRGAIEAPTSLRFVGPQRNGAVND